MKSLFAFLGRSRVFALAVALMLVFLAAVLPAMSARAAAYTPEGAYFDLAFFYTPARALEMVGQYEPQARAAYILDRWTFDLLWPLGYGFFMLSGWAFGLSRLRPGPLIAGSGLLLIPMLAVVFDLIENSAITVLMLAYPAQPFGVALAASAGTLIKWILVLSSMSGAVLLPLAGGIVTLLRRRHPGAS